MHIVIFVTVANKKEAGNIANSLIEKKLAACVNIVDKIESVFWWEGKVSRAREVLLVIKSRKTNLNKIIKQVRAIHSYSLPEIIAIPIAAGYRPYLEWINDSLR